MRARPYSSAVLALAALTAFVFAREPSSAGAEAAIRKGGGGNLGVIVEKDLFRPSRKKPEPPKPGPNPKPGSLAPAKRPAPEITLTGTVLLDTGGVAMLSWQGVSSGSGTYRVGDQIEDFVIVDITRDTVILRRGNDVLSARMSTGRNPAADWRPWQVRTGPVKNVSPAVPRAGVPSDMPAAGKGERENEMEENGVNEWTGK
ncbi:MAG: hypothetical protein H3C68_03715 [Deltaproteobacteria bacterium]|nr:hypothetical protein [Deltaproteobacteria bacterium]MBZ0219831.1 hypothetical protein [Deltaproteobacteria bacterium]